MLTEYALSLLPRIAYQRGTRGQDDPVVQLLLVGATSPQQASQIAEGTQAAMTS